MPLIKKIGEIEVYETSEDLNKYTRKQREEFINELFMKQYQGKEIHYLLNDKEIKAIINATTRKYFFSKQHGGVIREKDSERNIRINLVYENGFDNLIRNAVYSKTSKEYKPSQNSKHKIDNKWHYFIKKIIFNEKFYILIITLREYNSKFYIHNTRIKEKRDASSNL